jgi:hypothetical protein
MRDRDVIKPLHTSAERVKEKPLDFEFRNAVQRTASRTTMILNRKTLVQLPAS